MGFIKHFFVVLVVMLLIAGFLLTSEIGVDKGQYLLFTLVPILLGLLFTYSLLEKNPGVLAFTVVAIGLFVYLLMIKPGVGHAAYILAGVGAGAGLVLYLFQVKK